MDHVPRPFSFFLPSPPSSASPTQTLFDPPNRSKSPHYLPARLSQAFPTPPHSPILQSPPSRRPKSSSGLSNFAGSMGFLKQRESTIPRGSDASLRLPPPPPSPTPSSASRPSSSQGRFPSFNKSLRKKKSLASLLSIASDTTITPACPTPTYDFPRSAPLTTPGEEYAERSTGFPFLTVTAPAEEDVRHDYDSVDRYVRKNKWLTKMHTKLHPYPQQAPYMVSYDPILLDNDRNNHMLLRRLNPNGSPTFYAYGKKPPASVLDLGCGEGHWALDAARAWKNSKIVAFDLVDVTLPEVEAAENIQVVRGNFVQFELPFEDQSFELVRMSDLTLCIPHDKWEFVLSEAYRVLTVGGRLELIDDQIFFSYGNEPRQRPFSFASTSSLPFPSPPKSAPPTVNDDSFFELESDEEDGDVYDSPEDTFNPYQDDAFYDPTETLVGSGSSSSTSSSPCKRSLPALPVTEVTSAVATMEPHTFDMKSSAETTPTHPEMICRPMAPTPSVSSWSESSSASTELEIMYETMLHKKYGIHTRPSEFMVDLMRQTFGTHTANKMKSMHLKLAPSDVSVMLPTSASSSRTFRSNSDGSDKELQSDVESANWKPSSDAKPKKVSKDRKFKEANDMDVISEGRSSEEGPGLDALRVPGGLSAKAAARLGINYSQMVGASTTLRSKPSSASLMSSTSSSSTTYTHQSPGLILWPSTFIPMAPDELEMHACKHLHTLLGTKAALGDYCRSFVDEQGNPFVDETSFADTIWNYECFRRWRFNWPSEVPDNTYSRSSGIVELAPKSGKRNNRSGKPTHSLDSDDADDEESPFEQDQLTHVRTIRVFEAIKSVHRAKAMRY